MLDARALNRALLERQLLLERSPLPVKDAVSHLVGMQAQAVNPPYFGLWTRLLDFHPDALSALLSDRTLVRIALMRSTLHLVTAEDSRGLRTVLADSLARAVQGQYGRQTSGVDLTELAHRGAELTRENPLTFAELGEQLTRWWPDRDANALAQTVRNLVPLVQIPPRGLWGNTSAARHTTAAHWLGPSAGPAPTIDDYVLRYLGAFGPASVADMQKWSGLTRLNEVVSRLGPRLRTYEADRPLFDLADRDLPDADQEVPVRFLPEFDNILLSHADRRRIMADEYRARVFTVNGIIRSAILVDGFVEGLWRIERRPGIATLIIEPFRAIAGTTLTDEGQKLLHFAAPEASDHDIRLVGL